jgi:(+)-trans-carveol dehydrogenase
VGRFDSKVVFITGAARGQGRSHAVRFAREGAHVIAVDACAPVSAIEYPLATEDDLETTASLVRAEGGRVVTAVADVRDQRQLDAAVTAGVAELGRLDVVCANAGIFTHAENSWTMTEEQWSSVVDINLGGVWRTCKAAVPAMIQAGNGGAIIMTGSSNGYRAEEGHVSYNAAKLGLVGVMRSLAAEVGEHGIRVNSIHPTMVKTGMMWNDAMVGLFFPGKTCADADEKQYWNMMSNLHILPTGALDPSDVSGLVLYLASDEAQHITACEFPIDGGYIRKNRPS